MKRIIYIIGVSGSGKSTIGKLLSKKTAIPFFDADDYHSKENISKMTTGVPLTDSDRKGWLTNLNALSKRELANKGAIIACSALKESYRDLLNNSISNYTKWIHLKGSKELIEKRMKARNHFMPTALIQSQFNTLEAPDYGLQLSIEDSPERIVETIQKHLNL